MPEFETPAWIESIAASLIDLEAEVHEIIARKPTQAATSMASMRSAPTITMTQGEAWLLARCALPLPLRTTRLAAPHARVLTALNAFAGALLACNEPWRPVDRATEAGVALLGTLKAWIDQARWTQACQHAHVRWAYDARGGEGGRKVPITTVMQRQTDREEERFENAASIAAMASASRNRSPFPVSRRMIRQEEDTLAERQTKALTAFSAEVLHLQAANEPEGAATMSKPARATSRKPAHRLSSLSPVPAPKRLDPPRHAPQIAQEAPRPLGLPSVAPKRAATR